MTYKKVLIYQTTLKIASKIRSIFSILCNSYFFLLSFLEVFVNVWKLYQSDDYKILSFTILSFCWVHSIILDQDLNLLGKNNPYNNFYLKVSLEHP